MGKEPGSQEACGEKQKPQSTSVHELGPSESDLSISNDDCRPLKELNGAATQPVYYVEQSFPELRPWREETETIDLGMSLTKDITESGSFDIRGDIWARTFGKVLQAIPMPGLLIDKSFHVVVANQACSKISAQYESILGSPFSCLFLDTSSRERTQQTLEAIFKDRRPRQIETMLQIDDDWIWARISFRSIRIKADRLVLTLIEDLTAEKGRLMLVQSHERSLKWESNARRRAEEALRRSESRFATIYHTVPVMIHAFDSNSIVRSVNAKWLAEMGYDREQIVGKPMDCFLSETSKENFHALFSDLWHIGEISNFHCQYLKKDKTFLGVVVNGAVTDDPKWGLVCLTSSTEKITKRM